MKTISVLTTVLLFVAGTANATNRNIESAQPITKVDIVELAHEEVKITMADLVSSLEIKTVKPVVFEKMVKNSNETELLANNTVIAE